MWLLTGLGVLLVTIVCLIIVASTYPKFRQQLSQQQEERATLSANQTAIAAVEQAGKTATAVKQEQESVLATQQYQSAMTATQAALPTVTPTLTPAPLAVACEATVSQVSRPAYPVPSEGDPTGRTQIAKDQSVEVMGRISDSGWYKIQYQNKTYWMRGEYLRFNNCTPTLYDLSYLLGLASPDQAILLEDTFVANYGNWKDQNGNLVSIKPDPRNNIDQQLIIATYPRAWVRPDNSNLREIGNFHLYTSFQISSADPSQQLLPRVGIRFSWKDPNYYLISIYPQTCKISVEEIGAAGATTRFERNLIGACNQGPDYFFYLDLEFSESVLTLKVNGFEPATVNLDDPSGSYATGTLAFEAQQANVRFDFITITAPK
jgi:hypothetical protein